MIGKISGRLEMRAADHVMIDVQGVGYLVYCSERTLAALPAVGTAVALYTELLVREDLLQLFGFLSIAEKEWHRLLTSVQGVGAKAALAILGALGADGVSRAIALGDWNAVRTAKGVGPKIAQRVVLDLKDKAPSVMALGEAGVGPAVAHPAQTAAGPMAEVPPSSPTAQAEALSALTNLGYAPGDAAAAVAQALSETPDAETSHLIRAALKLLAPSS
ncbi:MAG: Holliday junction branch migration protein RuvA [Pseudomonadota bacterium]